MAVRSYVIQECLSGSSSDDVTCDVYQMSLNDQFAISDPIALIADDIYTSVSDIIDLRYRVQHIRKILRSGQTKGLLGYKSDSASILIHADNENKVYYYDVVNTDDYKFRKVYRVQELDDEKVGYVVLEYIPYDNNRKFIKRCYSPYFKDLDSAVSYLDSISENCENIDDFRISVFDIDELSKADWYSRNVSAFDKILRYDLDPNKYRKILDFDELDDMINADAYNRLSAQEQADVDYDLYQRLYDYLPVEITYEFDMDLENAEDVDVMSITDRAIALALVQATSEDEFNEIYDVLGPHKYRIDNLTDEIYNSHPDAGYILVTVDGEMKWYPECYFINSWEGAKLDNPYYGKFQPNTCETLLCFKEYHPELIVDNFPSPAIMNAYAQRYKDVKADIHRRHSEMYFYVDDENDEIVVGDWYYNGVYCDDVIRDVAFMRMYGEHSFTEEECRLILSGEEVVIENFKTKSGIVTTIRGRLRSASGAYDENTMVEFIRTDLDFGARRKINSEMGIVEPGVSQMQSI